MIGAFVTVTALVLRDVVVGAAVTVLGGAVMGATVVAVDSGKVAVEIMVAAFSSVVTDFVVTSDCAGSIFSLSVSTLEQPAIAQIRPTIQISKNIFFFISKILMREEIPP
jgi:hypothetical protein